MQKITFITPTFAVTSAMQPGEFAAAAALGFRCIVSNLPDGEDATLASAREEAVAAWRNGLTFAHVPVSKLDPLAGDVVERMADILLRTDGPVLAHCRSGTRSAIVWAAASARSRPVECVLEATRQAGFDLDFLREDFEHQKSRKHWVGTAPESLDCGAWRKSPRRPAFIANRADLALLSAAAHAL